MIADRIGDIGINAFSIISYTASFTLAVFFGTSEGLQPLFGQSYGAKEKENLKFYFRVGFALNYVVKTMPKFIWSFIAVGINVIISAYFILQSVRTVRL